MDARRIVLAAACLMSFLAAGVPAEDRGPKPSANELAQERVAQEKRRKAKGQYNYEDSPYLAPAHDSGQVYRFKNGQPVVPESRRGAGGRKTRKGMKAGRGGTKKPAEGTKPADKPSEASAGAEGRAESQPTQEKKKLQPMEGFSTQQPGAPPPQQQPPASSDADQQQQIQ